MAYHFFVDHRAESINLARTLSAKPDAVFWSVKYAGSIDQKSFEDFENATQFLPNVRFVEANIVRFHEAGFVKGSLFERKLAFLTGILDIIRKKTGAEVQLFPFSEKDLDAVLPWGGVRRFYIEKFDRPSAYEELFNGR